MPWKLDRYVGCTSNSEDLASAIQRLGFTSESGVFAGLSAFTAICLGSDTDLSRTVVGFTRCTRAGFCRSTRLAFFEEEVRMRFRAIVLALVVLFTASSLASAQQQTGEIFGKVTDSSGAVMPGVTVTLTSPILLQP